LNDQKVYDPCFIVNEKFSYIFLLRFIKNQNSVGQLLDTFVKSSIHFEESRMDVSE